MINLYFKQFNIIYFINKIFSYININISQQYINFYQDLIQILCIITADIINLNTKTNPKHYSFPAPPSSPIQQILFQIRQNKIQQKPFTFTFLFLVFQLASINHQRQLTNKIFFNHMQPNKSILIKHLNEIFLATLKTTSQQVKSQADKKIYNNHNDLMNKLLLLSNDKDVPQIMMQILAHLMKLVQVKSLKDTLLVILTKFIECFKFYVKKVHTNQKIKIEQNSPKNDQKSSKIELYNPIENVGKNQQKSIHLKGISRQIQCATTTPTHRILTQLIDILLLLQNKIFQSKLSKTEQDLPLRLIQITFSLIDQNLITFMQYNEITKLYSIGFQCYNYGQSMGQMSSILQNISVSCVFSLTEGVFQRGLDCAQILLGNFLQYLFGKKRFAWIKDGQLNTLLWDMVLAAIKASPTPQLRHFIQKQHNLNLINMMYKIAAEKAFNPKSPQSSTDKLKSQPNSSHHPLNKNSPQLKSKNLQLEQLTRCYKAFIILSVEYSLKTFNSSFTEEKIKPEYIKYQQFNQTQKQSTKASSAKQEKYEQYVPFVKNLKLFNIIYQEERNVRMYLYLEGLFELMLVRPGFLIQQDKGYKLLEIVSKISEELCHCGGNKIDCANNWTHKTFLDKFLNHQTTFSVTDGDFVKIIRNQLIKLRKGFEKLKQVDPEFGNEPSSKKQIREENATQVSTVKGNDQKLFQEKSLGQQSYRSHSYQTNENSLASDGKTPTLSTRRKWQRIIRCIIKIIRYLSSLTLSCQSDQQPVRKIILELQSWFLIAPSGKIRNLILQELMITTNTLNTKEQAIKVSQCIQIGSNLIYGYYDMLDSVGLTIIMKMMAGIKALRDEGKEFQELEQVFEMSQKLYLEQRIVKNQQQFTLTIQAFIQCANSLAADLEQPPKINTRLALGKNPAQKYYRMIDYLLEKLQIVVIQNCHEQLFKQWDFLTGFWMSFCANRNQLIKFRTVVHVGSVVLELLKQLPEKQQELIGIYMQMAAKYGSRKDAKIQLQIANQLKNFIPLIECQAALIETFKVIKILYRQPPPSTTHSITSVPSTVTTQQKNFLIQLNQLQQIFIKQGIHKIKQTNNLRYILQGLRVIGQDKNLQYRIFQLLWMVADHLRHLMIATNEQKSQQSSKNNQNKNNLKKQQQETLVNDELLWEEIFYKLVSVAEQSPHAETKQSAIHTFTQIIAQNCRIHSKSSLIKIYKQLFISKLFISLITPHNQVHHTDHSHDVSLKVDMIRVSCKNYIKLTKKFINEGIFSLEEDKQIISFVLIKLRNYFKKLNEEKIVLPVEVLYELLVLVEKFLEGQEGLCGMQLVDLQLMRQIVIEEMGNVGEKVQHGGILWKKKYLPHYQQTVKKLNDLTQAIHPTSSQSQSNIPSKIGQNQSNVKDDPQTIPKSGTNQQ